MNTLSSRILLWLCIAISIVTTFILLRRIDQTYAPIALIPISPKYIALTFDDGPYGKPTEEILDILKDKHVPATFFVVGKNVEQYPDILRREYREGHTIGNHSYDHAHLGAYTREAFRANLADAEQAIVQTIGVSPLFFRAPYGMTSPQMIDELTAQGYTYVGWNEDPTDWDFTNDSSAKILASVLKYAHANGIIILHDGRDVLHNYPRQNTISALPAIIDHLHARGYTFVTIDQLKHIAPYQIKK